MCNSFSILRLGGILAAYGRIAILKSTADTLFNLSEIHVDVEGDFYVFKPEIGRVLTGKRKNFILKISWR